MTTGELHSVEIKYVPELDNVECQVYFLDVEGDTHCVIVNLDLSLTHNLLGQLGDAAAAAEFAAEGS